MASHDDIHNGSIYTALSSFLSTTAADLLFPHPNTSTLATTYSTLSNSTIKCDDTTNCNLASADTSLDSAYNKTEVVANHTAWHFGSNSPYGKFEAIVIFIVLASIIIGTIVGNILVCVAVCLVRKLRKPYNYLIVSLAVSDLCVAILVMPMAMMYEVLGDWPFGSTVCDFWVSFDVLSCSASILNLCMISVDRYYAITKPLQYGVKRTPKRMILYVFIVWFAAACVSLPPILILGNEKAESQCIVCQNFAYQIYATVGAFYLPLTVMIVVYYKIFRAARKIVMEEKRAQFHLEAPCYLEINAKNGGAAEAKLLVDEEDGPNKNSTPNAGRQARGSNTSTATSRSLNRLTATFGHCFSSGQRKSNESQCPMLQKSSAFTPVQVIQKQTVAKNQRSNANDRGKSKDEKISAVRKMRNSIFTSNAKLQTPNAKDTIQATFSPHLKKLRFQLAKEKKASTTLGIIMSAFMICWLPFFVCALVRPFLEDQEAIPRTLTSLFLWLGYANSLLNPIIYATLNRDFRKPFQEILFFRCSNLNHIMREEFYHSHYGEPPAHYCAVNSYKPQNVEEEVEIVTNVGVTDNARDSATFL